MPRYPQLSTPDWLQQRIQTGDKPTFEQMAVEIGCSPTAILLAIRRYKIDYKPTLSDRTKERWQRKRMERWPQLMDRDWFVQKHEAEQLSLGEIANAVGCSVTIAQRARVLHGLQPHGRGYGKKKVRNRHSIPQLSDGDWLLEQLVTRKRSISELATELQCSPGSVGKAARRFRIDEVIVGNVEQVRALEFPRLGDEVWLRQEYVVKDRTAQQLADEIGCSVWAVQASLGRFRVLKHAERPRDKKDKSLPRGTTRKEGYLLVFRPEHPFANAKGYVPQHRLVVEEVVGRNLTRSEEVHHVNSIRDDNRLDNLMLMPNFREHRLLEFNHPPWIPRCGCCGEARPRLLSGRPSWVPLVFDRAATYSDGPPVSDDYVI